jgi:hypothetical protein
MQFHPPALLASELYHILRAVDEAVRVNHRRFGAEVKMTDASNSGAQDASVDATSASWAWEWPSLLKAGFAPSTSSVIPLTRTFSLIELRLRRLSFRNCFALVVDSGM